jgi:hypothetical protein
VEIARLHAVTLDLALEQDALVRVAVRDRHRLAPEVRERADARRLRDHERGAVAMAEVDDLDRQALASQRHRQRRQDERGLELAALELLGDGRELGVLLRAEHGAGVGM